MMTEPVELRDELANDAQIRAETHLTTYSEAMGQLLCDLLEEQEIATNLQEFHATARGRRGRQLNIAAVGEDPIDGSMSVVVTKTSQDSSVSLGTRDIEQAVAGAQQFVEMSLSNELQQDLEESSPAFDLAEYLREGAMRTTRYRVEIASNLVATHNVKQLPLETASIDGTTMSFRVWDAARLTASRQNQSGREPIEVKLGPGGAGVPCLLGSTTEDGLKTYIFTLNGGELARIYHEHGSQVLESNVRGFLSIRGKVNKGIQNTLGQEPEMFVAFNNGLTTTATDAEIIETPDGAVLKSLTDWQIVNGGQTTASMWHFQNRHSKNPEKLRNLESASVQVKLVVVRPEKAQEIVPDIAKYANSQNKVSVSDFSSNSPFHRRMDRLSQKVHAPASDRQYDTRWFYERTRGAYDNTKARRTGAAKKQFELEHPKAQKFDKLELAKADTVWRQEPHLVSRGAQTAFATFSDRINSEFDRNDSQFNESYFRNMISRIIILRETRQHVMRSEWYGKGYLANIVAYGVSKMLFDFSDIFPDHQLDLRRVWEMQTLDEMFVENLDVACHAANDHLTSPNRPQGNVTQWAKQSDCWESFREEGLEYYETVEDLVATTRSISAEAADAVEAQAEESKILGYLELFSFNKSVWQSLQMFVDEFGDATDKERGVLRRMLTEGYVTERQGKVLARLLQRAESSGFRSGR